MSDAKESRISARFSEEEGLGYRALVESLRAGGVPDGAILAQLQLYQPRVALSHTLFLNEIYQQILRIPGNIAEFGVQWGRNLAAFHSLRSIHEPTNVSRHIIGFDTFSGFPSVSDKDGNDPATRPGGLAVTPGWEDRLDSILEAHQRLSFRARERRFRLVKGDVCDTLPEYLAANPHSLFALLYIDLDLYEPTRRVLKLLWPRVPKGGVIVLDEVNLDLFPGETLALLETVDIGAHELRRSPYGVYQAYIVK